MPRTRMHRKPRKKRLEGPPIVSMESSPHAILDMHASDMARHATLNNPSVKKRIESLKSRLLKTATRAMPEEGASAMYHDDGDMPKKPMGKKKKKGMPMMPAKPSKAKKAKKPKKGL